MNKPTCPIPEGCGHVGLFFCNCSIRRVDRIAEGDPPQGRRLLLLSRINDEAVVVGSNLSLEAR